MNSSLFTATYYVKSIGIAALAVILAYVSNRINRKRFGPIAYALYAPVAEETLKTLLAVKFASSVLTVHVAFGVIEALMDAMHSERRLAAMCAAVVTHALFGAVTVLFWHCYNVYAGISASVLLHMLWNSFVVDLVNLQRKD